MKRSNFYKLIIVVLVLVNLTTVYFLWNSHESQEHPGPPHRKSLVKILSLTGDAKSKVEALEIEHFRVKDSLIDVSRTLHEQLFRSFNDVTKDSLAIHQLIGKIVENQRETEQMTFDYFKKVDTYCSPTQKKELQKTIHMALSRLNGPPPPPKRP